MKFQLTYQSKKTEESVYEYIDRYNVSAVKRYLNGRIIGEATIYSVSENKYYYYKPRK